MEKDLEKNNGLVKELSMVNNNNTIYLNKPSGLDDTDTIQQALNIINTNGGGTLFFNSGTYIISRTLKMFSNTIIEGFENKTIIDGSSIPFGDNSRRPYLIQSRGVSIGNFEITNNLVEGQIDIHVSGNLSNIKQGMLLVIRSKERQFLGAESHIPFKEEIQKIVEVNQHNSTIKVDSGLLFNYLLSPNLIAEVYEPTSNILIRNIKIIMGGIGSVHSGIQISYGYNINVNSIIVDGAENKGINISKTYRFVIKNSKFLNSTSPLNINFNSGYGILVSSSSCYGKIINNVFDNCRHGVSGGNHAPHHIEVISNLLTNCRIGYALDCHEPCMFWVIKSNTIQGCRSGITARGMYITVSDNSIKNIERTGISAGATSDNLPFSKQHVIVNNRITNTGHWAINLRGNNGEITGVIIKGNSCIKTDGIRVNNCQSVIIADNIVDQLLVSNINRNGMHIIRCKYVTISGNHLFGLGEIGVFNRESDYVNIINNIMSRGGQMHSRSGGIRAVGSMNLNITNNTLKDFTNFAIFATNSDINTNNIIFVNNIISITANNPINIVAGINLIENNNMIL